MVLIYFIFYVFTFRLWVKMMMKMMTQWPTSPWKVTSLLLHPPVIPAASMLPSTNQWETRVDETATAHISFLTLHWLWLRSGPFQPVICIRLCKNVSVRLKFSMFNIKDIILLIYISSTECFIHKLSPVWQSSEFITVAIPFIQKGVLYIHYNKMWSSGRNNLTSSDIIKVTC